VLKESVRLVKLVVFELFSFLLLIKINKNNVKNIKKSAIITHIVYNVMRLLDTHYNKITTNANFNVTRENFGMQLFSLV